jgi:hypothetical protein
MIRSGRRKRRTFGVATLGAIAWLGYICVPAAAQEGGSAIARIDHTGADFGAEHASNDAQEIGNWVVATRDNQALPFVIIDKIDARVFVFDRTGRILGAAPALLGIARGDDSVPGIGERKLATIRPEERTTPAGRFQASLGYDFEQDILWIDYNAALSMHRVIVGNPKDRRAARLASPSPLDNRISYGCVNVPAAFYDTIVVPAFKGTVGIVYILPETKPLDAVFALHRPIPPARGTIASTLTR